MTQARVVIRGELLPLAQRIQDATKLSSLTELMGVLLTRYGTHLEQTWEVTADAAPAPVVQGGQTPVDAAPPVSTKPPGAIEF